MYTPDEIAEHQFLISLRGYDRDEVSAFLDEIAGQVRTLQQRIAELESKAEERRAEEPAPQREGPADEAAPSRSFREVGEQTARILETAEQTAEEMRSRAERHAQEVREEAERVATEQREDAAREAARLREEAERDATQRREQADQQSDELLEEARRKAREEQERANETATEVLEDARRSARETLDTAEAQQREIAEQVAELRDAHARLQADLEAVSATVGQALDRLAGKESDLPDTEAPEREVEVPGPGPAVATDLEGDVAEEPPGDETNLWDREDREDHGDHGDHEHPEDHDDLWDHGDHEDHGDHGADEAEDDTEHEPDGEVRNDAEGAPAVADAASRQLRDQALTGIRPGMLRRLKRTLQDVQNGVLDALRREGADADVTRLLPGDDELAPLLSVGEAFLGEAYRAGLGDGATIASVSPDGAAADDERIAAAAAEFRATLGHETVAALEPSLAAGLDAGEDETALADRVSEVFRDLKGPVAESSTEASLLRIYELGTHDAWQHAGVGTRIWVLGEESRCPENRCRANADEGPVPLDRPFASGDVVPPAHGGCTCTLAPS